MGVSLCPLRPRAARMVLRRAGAPPHSEGLRSWLRGLAPRRHMPEHAQRRRRSTSGSFQRAGPRPRHSAGSSRPAPLRGSSSHRRHLGQAAGQAPQAELAHLPEERCLPRRARPRATSSSASLTKLGKTKGHASGTVSLDNVCSAWLRAWFRGDSIRRATLAPQWNGETGECPVSVSRTKKSSSTAHRSICGRKIPTWGSLPASSAALRRVEGSGWVSAFKMCRAVESDPWSMVTVINTHATSTPTRRGSRSALAIPVTTLT